MGDLPGKEGGEGAAPRRAEQAGRWRRPGRLLRDLNLVALLVVIAAGAALLLLPISDDGLLGLPELRVGDLAPRNLKSPRAFTLPDPDTTDQVKRDAVAQVRPTYDLLVGLGGVAKSRIETAFGAGARPRPEDRARPEEPELRERARAFMLALGVTLEEDALFPLLEGAADELRDAAIMVAQSIHEHRIVEDKALLALRAPKGLKLRMVNPDGTVAGEEDLLDYRALIGLDQARARIDDLVAQDMKRFPVEQRRAVAMLVKKLLRPSLLPNEEESERRRLAEERAVKTVMVAVGAGETVVRGGERITSRHLFILGGIEKELRAQSRLQAAAGSALLIMLLVVAAYRFASRSYLPNKPSHRDLAFLASAYVVLLLLSWISYKAVLFLAEHYPLTSAQAYRFLVPVASAALLVRLVAGFEAAAAFTAVAGVTAGWMMDVSLGFTAFAVAGSLAAASVAEGQRPRRAILAGGARAAIAQAGVVLALALLSSSLSLEETSEELLAAVASGALSALLAGLLLPAVEVLYGYTTDLKLGELADLNHPLLRELLVEAPGTYHHAMTVGALAEAAAAAIGANPLLARVGGYYHDIGKIQNPRAYVENDPGAFAGVPAITLAKELSAHVADGERLAVSHRLGQPLIDIIQQHHGSAVVRAAAARLPDAQAREAALREISYGGPKPRSREAALVMLADSVEVGTRDLAARVGVTRGDIERAVRRVVNEVLEEGQLDACDLCLRDLRVIIASFTAVFEERWVRRGRPPTLSSVPTPPASGGPRLVRAPPGGEPN